MKKINNEYISSYESIKEIPNLIKEKSQLKEVDSCLLRTSIFNLEDSFKRYKSKISEYPKFKSKMKSKQSYRTNNIASTYKVKLKLQVVYKKLKNARKNLIHNISNKIVKENDIIVTETLKISKMVENKKIYEKRYKRTASQLNFDDKK